MRRSKSPKQAQRFLIYSRNSQRHSRRDFTDSLLSPIVLYAATLPPLERRSSKHLHSTSQSEWLSLHLWLPASALCLLALTLSMLVQRVIGRLIPDATRWLGLQIPLLRAPAACWCVRQMVESTLTSQVMRLSEASPMSIFDTPNSVKPGQ
jgi:hypothetical protein